MKRIALLFALTAILASCNTRYEQENDEKGNITRKTTEKTPFKNTELEMKGTITFNDAGTEITGISNGGYVKYISNEMALEARPGKNGTVGILIHEDGNEVPSQSEKGKELLEDAIGRMQRLQEKYNQE